MHILIHMLIHILIHILVHILIHILIHLLIHILIHSNLFKPKINEVSNRLTSDKNEDNIAIEDRLLLHGQMYDYKAKLREDLLIKDTERECSHIHSNNNDHYHAMSSTDKSSDVNALSMHARTIGTHAYICTHTYLY